MFAGRSVLVLAVVCCLCGTVTIANADVNITLNIYNLPRPDDGPSGVPEPVDDEVVEVSVSEVDVAASIAQGSDVVLVDGDPLVSGARLVPNSTGTHTITVPLAEARERVLVNIRLNRAGDIETQVLRGIVLENGQSYRYDLVVPKATPSCMLFCPSSDPVIRYRIHRRRWHPRCR